MISNLISKNFPIRTKIGNSKSKVVNVAFDSTPIRRLLEDIDCFLDLMRVNKEISSFLRMQKFSMEELEALLVWFLVKLARVDMEATHDFQMTFLPSNLKKFLAFQISKKKLTRVALKVTTSWVDRSFLMANLQSK